MSLTVITEQDGSVLMARMTGDLDREAEPALSDLGESLEGARGVVIDFSDSGFISSSGLALLVKLVRAGQAAGATVVALGLDDHYKHVFEITRLDQFIVVADDHDAALAAAGR